MGVIIQLYKCKDAKADCSSYRMISLLSVPGKVFTHVLLERLKPLVQVHHRPQQSGFTPDISTADVILALRLLVELHLEFHRPLHVTYVDMKSAFDSDDRWALWLGLQGICTPDVVLHLLRDLHSGTGARVRVGSATSDRFTTTSGVRRGCVPALAHFCRVIDWIMEHMSGLKGVTLGRFTVTDLDYADDIALPAARLPDLELCLSGFSPAARTMGLLSRHIASDRNCNVLDGFLISNLESGEVVLTYENLSLHDVYYSSSLVRLGVVDQFGLGYLSPGSFPYVMSETESSREMAGYGPQHSHFRKD